MTDVTLTSDYKYGDTIITVSDGSQLPSAPHGIIITNGRFEKITITYNYKASNSISNLTIVDGEIYTLYPKGSLVTVVGGGGGGTDDYTQLQNKPQINSNELIGNKSGSGLGIISYDSNSKNKVFTIGKNEDGRLYYME